MRLSPGWPSDWGLYLPNMYLLDSLAGSAGYLYPYSTTSIPEIKSWTIINRDGEEVHRHENFPPNDTLYGWDGRVNGQYVEDLYASKLIVTDPDGNDSEFYRNFCCVLCDNLKDHRAEGLNFDEAFWNGQHDGNGGWTGIFISEVAFCLQ